MGPDAPKKGGCCFGGCLGVVFWLGLTFAAGWYACNLEHNNWQFGQAASDSLDRLGKNASNLWKKLYDTVAGMGGTTDAASASGKKATPAVPNTNDWAAIAAESQRKAVKLLDSARKATGEEQERFLRMAQRELQNAYDNYVKAEQVDTGNQELTRKIAELAKMLEQFKRR